MKGKKLSVRDAIVLAIVSLILAFLVPVVIYIVKGVEGLNDKLWVVLFFAAPFVLLAIAIYVLVGSMRASEKLSSREAKLEAVGHNLNNMGIDHVTGVYNRAKFHEMLPEINKEENLPITCIFGDVNGLKLTNDIFGHTTGDELLALAAKCIKEACGEKAIVARVGGDEFSVIIPLTSAADATEVLKDIRDRFEKYQDRIVFGGLALGSSTKTSMGQELKRIIRKAENEMYFQKTLSRTSVDMKMIKTITEELHHKSGKELHHAINVSRICVDLSRQLGMAEESVRKVKDAGYLHDIGKVVVADEILNKTKRLNEKELLEIQQHSMVGYRILNLFDNTLDLAEGVLYHHERWDGTGYPKGLKGEEIPKLARVISISEVFEVRTSKYNPNQKSIPDALE